MSQFLSPTLAAHLPAAKRAAEAVLIPATVDDFRRYLAPCLVLTAPSGMAQADQSNWLVAARGALDGVPADLLRLGTSEATRIADHPSKIIPAILRTIDGAWRGRRADLAKVNRMIEKCGDMA